MMMIPFVTLDDLETHIIGLAMLFSAGTFPMFPDIHNPETGRSAMVYVLLGSAILGLSLFGMDAIGLLEHSH
tara:strand:+ start:217 stop:432 length:216 start_codon:yes stop_codon:yes gene_type:complete